MTLFNVVLAYNVPVYGNVEIEAASLQEAVEQVRKAALSVQSDEDLIWDLTGVDHVSPHEHRIVFIEDEDGSANVSDIGLTHHDAPWIILSAEEVAAVLADAEISEELTA